MAKQTTKRKRGRPRLPPDEAKHSYLNMRTKPEVRRQIEKAAAKSGRSLVAEVEHRIEASFHEERLIERAFTGASGKLLRRLLTVIENVESSTGLSIEKDPYTAAQARQAVDLILDADLPRPQETPKPASDAGDEFNTLLAENLGAMAASGVLCRVWNATTQRFEGPAYDPEIRKDGKLVGRLGGRVMVSRSKREK